MNGVIKDNDLTIQYRRGKVNVVEDALSQKTVSISIFAYLSATKWPFSKEIHSLESKYMQLCIYERDKVLASIEVKGDTFIEEIKDK